MAMDQERYDEWAAFHASVFGMDSDKEVLTFQAWQRVFSAAGYTVEDLMEASQWLAAHPPTQATQYNVRRDEHLRALQERIRARRAIVPHEEMPDDRGTCTLCGGSGRVTVPNLECVRDGQWLPLQITRGGARKYTSAVTCRCPLGRWFAEKTRDLKGRRQMSLDEYERSNPLWREHTEEQRREQNLGAQASAHNNYFDQMLGRLRVRAGLAERDLLPPSPVAPNEVPDEQAGQGTEGENERPRGECPF